MYSNSGRDYVDIHSNIELTLFPYTGTHPLDIDSDTFLVLEVFVNVLLGKRILGDVDLYRNILFVYPYP